MCADMCADMCMDMCMDLCTDLCTDMCTDVCMDTFNNETLSATHMRMRKRIHGAVHVEIDRSTAALWLQYSRSVASVQSLCGFCTVTLWLSTFALWLRYSRSVAPCNFERARHALSHGMPCKLHICMHAACTQAHVYMARQHAPWQHGHWHRSPRSSSSMCTNSFMRIATATSDPSSAQNPNSLNRPSWSSRHHANPKNNDCRLWRLSKRR